MSDKKFILVLILVGMMTLLSINSIILLVKDNNRTIDRIRKEIQVNDVEMTEDGILIQLNVNGELDYYYYKCE